MASPISILSLFVLVLISGYFTLPISENELSGLLKTSFEHDFTTEKSLNTRDVLGDDIITTPLTETKRSVDEHVGFESNTVISRPEREIIEPLMTTVETLEKKREIEDPLMTTEESSKKKREMDEPLLTTLETLEKREIEELLMTTVETSEKKREIEESLMTTVEPLEKKREIEEPLMTTVETLEKKREIEEPLMTTVGTLEKKREIEEPLMATEEMKTESEPDKRALPELDSATKSIKEMRLELTTSRMPLFTSTSSAKAPELYTRGSIDFSSINLTTQKYVGSLVDRDDDEHKTDEKEEEIKDKKHGKEEEHEPEKSGDSEETKESKEKRPLSTKKDSDNSDEDKKYVTGVLSDQGSSKSFPSRPSDYALLDESDAVITTIKTELPEKIETFTEKSKLTQGKESS